MNNSWEELDRVSEELGATAREFDRKFDQWTSIAVSIPIGPRRLRSFDMSPLLLSWIVNLGNLTCFGTGLSFVFSGGSFSTVGVALLVGALFSEGAFLGQLWTASVQSGYASSQHRRYYEQDPPKLRSPVGAGSLGRGTRPF